MESFLAYADITGRFNSYVTLWFITNVASVVETIGSLTDVLVAVVEVVVVMVDVVVYVVVVSGSVVVSASSSSRATKFLPYFSA